ncbi:hypothetical protein [Nostoc sp. ChiSLP03a]|uniref:hypothetical protein n=1 Tax=Nostoc sp. ChiSLP03a TaxID=3075380 RepID=UPI002AD3D3D7|nr:hypothetical protein [Nostoc sp. ChiSLP03a]MDZ8213073.1 hypothetical protein [Nostoc sp. ChiSLP03a]
MKLKPGLFQLIVFVMTVSLLASCATTPEARQSDCISTTSPNKQANNCSPSSNGSGRSSGYSGGSSIRRFGSGDSSEAGTSRGSAKGRSGFGSFGRGGHAGG